MANVIPQGVLLNAMWAVARSLRRLPTRYETILSAGATGLVGTNLIEVDDPAGALLDKGANTVPGALALPDVTPTFDLNDSKTRYQKFHDGLITISAQIGDKQWAFPLFSDPPLKSGFKAMRGISIKYDYVNWTDVPYGALQAAYLQNNPGAPGRGLPFDHRDAFRMENAAHHWGRIDDWCTGVPNMHERAYDDGVLHFGVFRIHRDATIPRYREELTGLSGECRNCLYANPTSFPNLGAAGARDLARACFSQISNGYSGAIPVSRDPGLEIRFIKPECGSLFEIHPTIIECTGKIPNDVVENLQGAFAASQDLDYLPYGSLAIITDEGHRHSNNFDVGSEEEQRRKADLLNGFGLARPVEI